ncbi:hypothetical protein K504DRAFT_461197 [Pleomassaria siparia CBS 279.74]|uniref:DRBM domain-containing protein n=1 Tax=Pleomassaria siparia CBS 279.74 TaxID=1314801 RepID=A0A6G1JW04_9PLEO|nr:hypothetical protein K504DRAFT_461197 [Pleomassaria siparia CBS 279.74]
MVAQARGRIIIPQNEMDRISIGVRVPMRGASYLLSVMSCHLGPAPITIPLGTGTPILHLLAIKALALYNLAVHVLMIVTGLCQRRHWPDPLFSTFRTRYGYGCTVRVNNREYTTDVEYESDELAKNAAATRAYMICRNFSVNDGRCPGQGGVVQGLPVAIGTGRRNTCTSNDYDSASSSGGTSPRNSDCGLDSDALARRASKSSTSSLSLAPTATSSCFCGRGGVLAYERCTLCLREAGYRC